MRADAAIRDVGRRPDGVLNASARAPLLACWTRRQGLASG